MENRNFNNIVAFCAFCAFMAMMLLGFGIWKDIDSVSDNVSVGFEEELSDLKYGCLIDMMEMFSLGLILSVEESLKIASVEKEIMSNVEKKTLELDVCLEGERTSEWMIEVRKKYVELS